MGRCEGVVRGFVGALCTACVWSVVSAQSVGEGSSDGSPGECVGRRCAQYWWTSMWGFVVTLVVLSMDVWGYAKSMSSSKVVEGGLTLIVFGLYPLFMVTGMLEEAIVGMVMLSNLCDVLGHEMVAPLFPWSKSNIKIIEGTKVVVNLSPEAHKKVDKSSNAFYNKLQVKDFSEAVVIGTKKKDSSQYNVELSNIGKLALLRDNVLSLYDELKILRGNFTLEMVVAAVQVMGYIYAIVVALQWRLLLAVGMYFIINFKLTLNTQCIVLVVLFQGSVVLALVIFFFTASSSSYRLIV